MPADPAQEEAVGESEGPTFLLVDNGSIRAASTLALRETARRVSRLSGVTVHPVSLAYSDRVDPEELEGVPARTLPEFLGSDELTPDAETVIVPIFLGNRGAIFRGVEKVIGEACRLRPGLRVRFARFLFEEEGPDQDVLARAVAGRIREKIPECGSRKPLVVLTDHGSPLPVAAQVRNFVAGQVQAILRDEVFAVVPASMERREGKAYAFTDPLLEDVLRRPVAAKRPVVLAMFFLLPGRHAGEGGDVAEIRDAAVAETGNGEIATTELLGDHPLVVEALAQRIKENF